MATDDLPPLDPRILMRNFAMPEPAVPPPVTALPQAAQLSPAPRVTMPALQARQAAPDYDGTPVRSGGGMPDGRKPFGFALSNGTNGARIYFGTLIEAVTRINFKRERGVETVLNVLASQPRISKVSVHYPENLSADFGYKNATELTWFGDVYLYWEVSKNGEVNKVDVRGPEEPEYFAIPKLNPDLTREWEGNKVAKYWVLLGNVDPDTREVTQYISGDVTWAMTFIPENPKTLLPLLTGGDGHSGYTGDLFWERCDGTTVKLLSAENGFVTFIGGPIIAGCPGGTTSAPGL